jgi:isopenicillin N synthase-like dioxygenase
MKSLISILDWSLYQKGSTFQFVKQVKASFEKTGFFILKNHGISSKLLTENRLFFSKFFKELLWEQRMQYVFPDIFYQKGYTPMNIETGEFATVADNKHFYQLGDRYENPYITEIPDLQGSSAELYEQFYSLYKELMQIVALSLQLDKNFFDDDLGNSIMRHIHYPAHSNPMADDGAVKIGGNIQGMCASKHTDINDLTLLHATEPGLQLWHNNQWESVLCDDSMIIVNVGDMLWHLTGGHYKSGVHRVVCEPGIERFSSPFFGHRQDYCSVVPLEHLGEADLSKFCFHNEGEFLKYRLEQIMLKK